MKSRRAPRPIGASITAFTERLAPQTLLADVQRVWPQAAGAVMAAEATPTAERSGTLTITCRAAVWAQEIDLLGPVLVARINELLGADLVVGLRCQAVPPRGWAKASG